MNYLPTLIHHSPSDYHAMRLRMALARSSRVLVWTIRRSERSIAFASRSLSSAERIYPQIDREARLVWGIKKFRRYLYGRRFTLVTDHQPLVSIFNPRKGALVMSATQLQRWALFLGAHSCLPNSLASVPNPSI